MLVKLTEVCNNGAVTTKKLYSLREVFINPEHVVMIREEKRMKELKEIADRIVAYESGELDQEQTIQLFQELVDSGLIMKLQGHYGRLAFQLMEAGLITG